MKVPEPCVCQESRQPLSMRAWVVTMRGLRPPRNGKGPLVKCATSELACEECGAKWRSGASYVANLIDGKYDDEDNVLDHLRDDLAEAQMHATPMDRGYYLLTCWDVNNSAETQRVVTSLAHVCAEVASSTIRRGRRTPHPMVLGLAMELAPTTWTKQLKTLREEVRGDIGDETVPVDQLRLWFDAWRREVFVWSRERLLPLPPDTERSAKRAKRP